ncbi:MAG: hypothetical protein ACPGWS_09450 [Solirubrobacterales bacterium]
MAKKELNKKPSKTLGPLAYARRIEQNVSVGAGLSMDIDLKIPFLDVWLITSGHQPEAIHYHRANEGILTIVAKMRVEIRAIYVVPL